MGFKNFHAHLYYNETTLTEAKEIAAKALAMFQIPVGTFHQKPVGPHPVWSCQLSLSNENFGQVIPWLLENHGAVDIFVHGNSGHDLDDHTKYIMWIGKSYELNLEIFRD